MWTMIMNGRESNIDEVNCMNDSINLARFLPINPNPNTSHTTTTTKTHSSYCSNCSHTSTLPGSNHHRHHHQHVDKRNRRDFNGSHQQSLLGSSRWNPTSEQLLALEEMYRRGTRTPTAQEIQQIAARLRRFGRIEGKNVFYWFQNHKARERQKRRRREVEINRFRVVQLHDDDTIATSLDNKNESGFRRAAAYQLQHIPLPSSRRHKEDLFPMHAAVTAENKRRTNGWSQFDDERELLQQKNITVGKNATWQTQFLNPQRQSSQMVPNRGKKNHSNNSIERQYENGGEEVRTLQLFPICSESCNGEMKGRTVPITAINTNFSPNQFFEFLPLKN